MSLKNILVDGAIIVKNIIDVDIPLLLQVKRKNLIRVKKDINNILIMPSDPAEPSGSMGEVAMLTGLMQALRLQHPNAGFTLLGLHNHNIKIDGIGDVKVVAAWRGREGTIEFDKLLQSHDAFYGLGADVMDGKYGAALVCRFASYCNHAAKLGMPVKITGFSFNNTPRRPAVYALLRLDKKVIVNVRDNQSLARYKKLVSHHSNLSADVAFLMEPAKKIDPEIVNWINKVRVDGFIPVGVNINSHAFKSVISRIGVESLVKRIAENLAIVEKSRKIAFVLIPHDIKSNSGDVSILKLLDAELRIINVKHVLNVLISESSEIKFLTSFLDLVVTGRMHLAIAALGMKTPVLSITYQDKFEGLYEHFEMSETGVLTPDECITLKLSSSIELIIDTRQSFLNSINKNANKVFVLALNNV